MTIPDHTNPMAEKPSRSVIVPLLMVGMVFAVGVFVSIGLLAKHPPRSGATTVQIIFHEEKEIDWVRQRVLSIIDQAKGKPHYPDASIQTTADPKASLEAYFVSGSSRMFMIRGFSGDRQSVEADIRYLFQSELRQLKIN